MLIEINSYPKCGNTWLRYLLACNFNLDAHHEIPDLHRDREETLSKVRYVKIGSERVGFYKSHVTDATSLNPDTILCIYRHPLDVFLSSLNYFFYTNNEGAFYNRKPVTVDQLVEDGQLSRYFEDFSEHLGQPYYVTLLGAKSNYFEYLRSALENPKVVSVRYEDLYLERESELRRLFDDLFRSDAPSVVDNLFRVVDDKTKNTANPFFWKSVIKNYENYLSEAQIAEFNTRYRKQLDWLGY